MNEKNEVVLDWKTASEINTDKFVIQKSKDGRSFEKIGEEGLSHKNNFCPINPLTGLRAFWQAGSLEKENQNR